MRHVLNANCSRHYPFPIPQRTIIILHYFEELGVSDIADMLDIPAGTVKSRLYYARKKLRDLLGDDHAKKRSE